RNFADPSPNYPTTQSLNYPIHDLRLLAFCRAVPTALEKMAVSSWASRFPLQTRQLCRVCELRAPSNDEPVSTLVCLFRNQTDPRREVRMRAGAAGGAIVCADRRCRFCQLSPNRRARLSRRKLFREFNYVERESKRAVLELIGLFAHSND